MTKKSKLLNTKSQQMRHYVSGRRMDINSINSICLFILEGISIRMIARKMRLDRRIVQKYSRLLESKEDLPELGKQIMSSLKSNEHLYAYIEFITIENPLRSLRDIQLLINKNLNILSAYHSFHIL